MYNPHLEHLRNAAKTIAVRITYFLLIGVAMIHLSYIYMYLHKVFTELSFKIRR
jgi:hypothetical protein